jgi:hypothetical protein
VLDPTRRRYRHAQPSGRTRHRHSQEVYSRRQATTLGAVLFVVTVGLHWWLTAHMAAPIIQADEFGYLSNSHYLALGGPYPHTPGIKESPYNPGYSVLIAPLWWITKNPHQIYQWALHMNGVLAGLSALLAMRLAKLLAPGASWLTCTLVAAVVAAYPAFLGFSHLVESENLLVPGLLALALVAERAFRGREASWWTALGLLTGLLYAVHGRMLAVAVAVALVGGWYLVGRGAPGASRVGFSLGLISGLVASQLLIDAVSRGASHDVKVAGKVLGLIGARSGLAHVGAELAGQLLYLLVASDGLVVFGLFVCFVSLYRLVVAGPGGNDVSPRTGMAALMAMAFLGLWLLSAISLSNGTRIDEFIYGRYDEIILGPLFVIGLLYARRLARRFAPTPRLVWALAGVGCLLMAGLGWLVQLVHAGHLHDDLVPTNVFAVLGLIDQFGPALRPVDLALAGLGITLVALAGFSWRFGIGVILVLAMFVPETVAGQRNVVAQSHGVASREVVDTALSHLAAHHLLPSCVGFDSVGLNEFTFFNDRVFQPGQTFKVFDSSAGQRPCSALFISGAAEPDHADLIVPENKLPEDLYVLPGRLANRLAKLGWLANQPLLSPLPPPDRVAEVSGGSDRISMTRSAAGATIQVRVFNSSRAPFISTSGMLGPMWSEQLVAVWQPYGAVIGAAPGGDQKSFSPVPGQLAASVLPGESVAGTISLTVPPGDPPGLYQVSIQVFQRVPGSSPGLGADEVFAGPTPFW